MCVCVCVCVCFVCAHACVCVIILTPLFIGMYKASSLLLICSVFRIQGFASSSCMVNTHLARIMVCKPVYTLIIILITFVLSVGQDSSVGIATGYGLEVQGLNPGGGEIFHSCPDRP